MTTPLVAVPRTTDDLWSKVQEKKEELARELEALLDELGLPGDVTKSLLHQQDVWVQWTGMIGQPAGPVVLQRRVAMRVHLTAVPFHRYPILFRVELHDNDFHAEARDLIACRKKELETLVRALARGEVPGRKVARRLGLAHLRPGWFGLELLFGVVNKVDMVRRRYDLLVLGGLLGASILGGLVAIEVKQPAGFLIALAIGVTTLLFLLQALRLNPWVVSSGKPESEPRTLARWDEWQVLLPGLGRQAGKLREELLAAIRSDSPAGARAEEENDWNWGLDGKEERPRIVIGYRRAVGFVYVNPYAEDLYVGWNAHLNAGQWIESDVARGVLRSTGHLVALRSVVHGTQPLSEFDFQDATSLAEHCHHHVVKLVKRIVKEHEIDAEIDFRVIRERSAAAQKDQAPRKGGGLLGLFRRVS